MENGDREARNSGLQTSKGIPESSLESDRGYCSDELAPPDVQLNEKTSDKVKEPGGSFEPGEEGLIAAPQTPLG